jgi:hypothetical protein
MMGLMETTELSQADFTVESQTINFYAQDSWKVTNRLTINLGLRWDLFRAPDFSRDFASTWDFNTGKFLVGIAKPAACSQTAPPCLIDPNSDFVNRHVVFTGSSKLRSDELGLFGPRFGFAFQARPRTIVRGSYAIFYDLIAGVNQQAQNGSINNANWPGSLGRTVVSNNTQVEAAADAPFGANNPFQPTPTPSGRAFYYDPLFKNPRSQQWNLEIQQELARNLAWSVAYVGSHNVQLSVAGDYNTALTPGPGPVAPRQLGPQRWPKQVSCASNETGAASLGRCFVPHRVHLEQIDRYGLLRPILRKSVASGSIRPQQLSLGLRFRCAARLFDCGCLSDSVRAGKAVVVERRTFPHFRQLAVQWNRDAAQRRGFYTADEPGYC